MTTLRPVPRRGVPGVASSGRLVGVDVARSLALFGMMAAHVGDVAENVDWADPTSFGAVVNGRSAALFAVLAGVSIGLVSGRDRPPGPPDIGRVRARLALRAVVVVVVGLLLMALQTPVYVVLPTYGALFLLALPVLRWRPWALFLLAVACAVAAAPVALAILPLYAEAGMFGVQLGLVYPVVTFAAYVLVGLAVARSRPGSTPPAPGRHAGGAWVVLVGGRLDAAGPAPRVRHRGRGRCVRRRERRCADPVRHDVRLPRRAVRAVRLRRRSDVRAGVPLTA
ncbi:heparan-alpha-glucosaminide N-acetyltransferase domain-containing protein [Curtobacterium sp. MCPF17_052]|uniref:heparan-alpha-glucosaminide N-acetyltransferase domain-containing protein n=1 Tax=Curtobacterium sp. MCPF17_052 TaxID=2175655 RepID=UPI0024DF5164|nr:heparan-alpha-glucosaminide N-acetyltransferase domain-containing protein [Curtobacterium sp. MCPF17_052]WIB13104.1 heparan-alpha-glucosaminide N-acetyltransferase domain-containing protein [Curtobacterium sp. MCPF17_052]